MDDDQLHRLPKYAQESILALRREVATLIQALRDQKQDVPSKIRWGRHFMRHQATGYLPDDEIVYFTLADKPIRQLNVRLSEEGLKISADGRIVTLHESTNCCTIALRP